MPSGDTASRTGYGLRTRCLSFSETLSQSVANVAPTLTPLITVSLVFASAGNGTWFAYLFGTIGLALVGLNINQFARRSASPGSLYTFVTRGLGMASGFLSGWCLILAYLCTGMAVLAGAVNYGALLLAMVRLQVHPVILFGVGAAVAWYIAYRDIRLSTQLMLGLEATSMVIILVLGGIVLAHKGTVTDPAQFSLRGMNFSGFKAALILTIFCFVGYESATTLGEEARHPLQNIPRAVIWSAVISGLFFVLTSYIAVLGFRGLKISLADTKAPFNDLANDAGVGFFAVILSVGAVISAFACALACINAGARILFSMGRHGVVHEKIGSAHAQNATPHTAATVSSILVFLVPVIMVCRGRGIMDVFDDLGTIATYGFMVVYALVSVAAPVYLKRIGKLTVGSVVVSVVSVLFLIPPIVGAVYPAPEPPALYYPYYFLGYLAVGIVWFIYLSLRSRHVLERIRADLEHVSIPFEGDPETPPGA